MPRRLAAATLALVLALPPAAFAAKPKENQKESKDAAKDPMSADTFAGLALRPIGPALTSGRVVDLAVHPGNPKTYYVAVASGGVWKTTNSGTTWSSIFDDQGSYSIGALALDPKNPLVVWVGSGENNSQRSVGYGDGVYKSLDGGRRWENVGLKASEHIGMIAIDPRDPDVVYVAAQGPLWAPGGDRGLYKTSDGGKTWRKVLEVSENTGVSEVVLDPRDPDLIYAVAYQRRRHIWTLIDGGPESALYKSGDAGETWRKLEKGLPAGDKGRIGIAISPVDPDVLYAIVEAPGEEAGFYRSADRGENWEKRSRHVSDSPQYYQELVADPNVFDRVYSMDTFLKVTDDGGKTVRNAGEQAKHVDNHALWIDPDDSDHLLAGCDGGIYESFDRAVTWGFKANLPVTQFYKIAADEAVPFYNVVGGTQDNFSLLGPSRSTSANGITNADWMITLGGDGFESVVDPENPDIVYAQAQYGELARFDRASGEQVDIKPFSLEPREALRWNWDSPLLLSPHSPTRLYFASNRLFRSEDRGATWRPISPDLSRQLDRNQLPVMGRVWGIDAVAKNASTSLYGNSTALSESPLVEDLLYLGTDDGLVQVSEDGGGSWRKVESFPGVPERTYVARLEASRHGADVVYAAFNNHQMGDFKPYLLKSADRGRTWASIAGDLPERGSVWVLVEDHVEPDLLFAGTEFGVYFSRDGGKKWVELTGGMPTIAVRDLDVQEREGDLVVGTFGRGIFILDDYSPLRLAKSDLLGQASALFPVKRAWMYIERLPLGLPGPGFLGHSHYFAPNPPVGATFTYYLKEGVKTRKERRQEAEKKLVEEGKPVPYPSWEELRAEEREEKPEVVLTVTAEDGSVVRRLSGPVSAGMHRVSWDLRFPPVDPTRLEPFATDNPFVSVPVGPLVAPGTYRVSLALLADGRTEPLGTPQSFEAVPLGNATLPAGDRPGELAFQQKTARLQRAVQGAQRAAAEARTRLDHLQAALRDTPAADPAWGEEIGSLRQRLADLEIQLAGDPTIARRNEPTPPSISDRVQRVVAAHWATSSPATRTQLDAYEVAAKAFTPVLEQLRSTIEVDLAGLEARLEAAGAPWTPGRVPRWTAE